MAEASHLPRNSCDVGTSDPLYVWENLGLIGYVEMLQASVTAVATVVEAVVKLKPQPNT